MLLRAAIVGAGSIGREFAMKHLVEEVGVEVVAIIDTNIELATSLANDIRYKRAGGHVIGEKYNESVDQSTISAERP
jgi:glyceraldehyde-3-phosphate dehydrogenase/erythrose-4-phosphate dehydrogenase